ncbi:MAG: hypothetical protein ABSF38_01970 [Verrucomicrobiota bacterium]
MKQIIKTPAKTASLESGLRQLARISGPAGEASGRGSLCGSLEKPPRSDMAMFLSKGIEDETFAARRCISLRRLIMVT